ncbi:hypothetical protein B0H14DRAFT_2335405 [Mycena olivaceomarginata]|nr:hypothetical protein B0H14DRAFT_2335405 [Mycena olivaceomarginata]
MSKTAPPPPQYIDQTPRSDRPIPLYSSDTLARKTSSVITQLRTGPCPLNEYRFKAGFTNSPACEACGAATETRVHFILECPRWDPFRQPLYVAARELGPLHLSPYSRIPSR